MAADFYVGAVLESEPFVTQTILNEVIVNNFTTGTDYLADSVLFQFMMFGREMFGNQVSFNQLFQYHLFPEVTGGMANNIWAQMIAAGGWPLFLAFLGGFVVLLRVGSSLLNAKNLWTRGAAALAFAFWAFYIHRNDIGYQLGLEKRVLFVWFFCAICSGLLLSRFYRLPQNALRRQEPERGSPCVSTR